MYVDRADSSVMNEWTDWPIVIGGGFALGLFIFVVVLWSRLGK